ncbi:MAG: hypothetical protein IT175_02320 [Acidobacteria bacterium]|nr:hypothetical protein [Acidobacteriota bacterium]
MNVKLSKAIGTGASSANLPAGIPRPAKPAGKAPNGSEHFREANERRARRELSLAAIFNRAAGCRRRDTRALFDALFDVAER